MSGQWERPLFPDKPIGPKTSGEDRPVSDEASPGVPTPKPSGPRRAWRRASEETNRDRGAEHYLAYSTVRRGA